MADDGERQAFFRLARGFLSGLPAFLREMRGFPRRARYTLATRGLRALRGDIVLELATRLRRGTLAAATPASMALAGSRPRTPQLPLALPRSDEPHASIVIPVYDAFDHTLACLDAIREQAGERPFEVIVSDDGSVDATRELESVVAGVRVVRSPSNRGFIDACNRGAAASRGEFLVFLNNDTLVSERWLEQLLAPFEDPEVGLVGAQLVYPDGRLQEAGGIVFSDGSAWNHGRGDDPAHPKYAFRSDADYCSGACLAIRRELFLGLGGFDTRYAPMYYEDVDLAFAVRAAGRRVVYQPAAKIVHAEGGTAGSDPGRGAKRYQARNREILVEKWAEALAAQPDPRTSPDAARHWRAGSRVLVIDSYTPRPDRDAGSLRMLNILRILRGLGCRVSFLPENRAHDGDYTRALQAAGVEALYHPYLPSPAAHLEADGSRYDVVIISRIDVALEVLDAVEANCPRARRVFDTVDLHFLREARRVRLSDARPSAEAERLKARELAVARRCHLTLVVSPAEKDLIVREAPDLTVEVLSLIHTPEPTQTPFARRSGILFIANFQHPPNCDALEHYLREIHPAVRRRLPDAALTVIGSHVPKRLEQLASEGVHFVGHVPDIRPAFAGARLSIAPLRYGAGIKGKICTSLGFGVPVVTTTVGVEGMQLEHDDHVLVADQPEAFAEAVAALHTDEVLWERLAANGLRSVSSQFSVEHAARTLAAIIA